MKQARNFYFFCLFYIPELKRFFDSMLGFIRQLHRSRIDFESSEVLQCLFYLFIIYMMQVEVRAFLLPINVSLVCISQNILNDGSECFPLSFN